MEAMFLLTYQTVIHKAPLFTTSCSIHVSFLIIRSLIIKSVYTLIELQRVLVVSATCHVIHIFLTLQGFILSE